jgi:hypothetical protein
MPRSIGFGRRAIAYVRPAALAGALAAVAVAIFHPNEWVAAAVAIVAALALLRHSRDPIGPTSTANPMQATATNSVQMRSPPTISHHL